MLSSSWKLMSSENSGKSLTNVVSLPAGQEGHCHTEVKKQGKQDNLSGFFPTTVAHNYFTFYDKHLNKHFRLHLPEPRQVINCETFQGSAHCPVHRHRTVTLKTTNKPVYDSRCRILMTVQLWTGLLIPLVSATWLVTSQSETVIQEVKYDSQKNKKSKTKPKTKNASASIQHQVCTAGQQKGELRLHLTMNTW